MMTEISGQLERVTFASEETGFCVCRVKVKGERKPITAVGHIINPSPGEFLVMKGNWIRHPRYGEQFQIETCQTAAPATQAGMIKYLGSGLIKGIGPVMAKRIVGRFREKALDVIENDVDQLKQINGIGAKRIGKIRQAWEEQKEIRQVMVFLQSHGVSSGYAAKIYKQYGNDAISVVQANPYRLADDIFGIGFLTADKIAGQLGISPDSDIRIQAGIRYVLHKLSDQGHVCYPFPDLVSKTLEMLDVPALLIEKAIDACSREKKVTIETVSLQSSGEAENHDRLVFLTKYYFCENEIAIRLNRLNITQKSFASINASKAVEWVNSKLSIKLADKQVEAVKTAVTEKILVITGGPGTGKTTIINAILKIFRKKEARVLLAAPTGRAAKRMSETTWHRAVTIHRLLEYSPGIGGFKKNRKKPLNCDVLIIDEASMVDTILMYHLMQAVPDTAILILVGDVNQLPSVGAGNVLNDIISSRRFPVVMLDTIFRQAQKSLIVVNAHRINQGKFPVIDNKREKSNFYFIKKESPEDVTATILDLVQRRIPDRFGFDPLDDIQVLTPMHRGIAGASNLNVELQQILNPHPVRLTRGAWEFRVGDKVMQIRNNYDKNAFNGDIGRIINIDLQDQKVMVRFDGTDTEYDITELDEIVLAYAVSVHKSQGSEYPAVIIPVITQHYILLQRNLVYTAVTRGKKLVVLVGTSRALAIAINTAKANDRYTRLSYRLQ